MIIHLTSNRCYSWTEFASYLLNLSGLTLVMFLGSSLTSSYLSEAAEFELVPDRPGYADSTQSVAHRHWHIELGSSWVPNSDVQGGLLIRYGLPKGWELRLASPTFTQVFAQATPIDPHPQTPDLGIGGASIGAKWSYQRGALTSSIVTMVGIPVRGSSVAVSPDALLSMSAQIDYPLNQQIHLGVVFKSALLDQTQPAIESAYGEELGGLFALVTAISWSEIDWSIYAQSGAELVVDTTTPLVGVGGTLRVMKNAQFDLYLDAPLGSDGINLRYGGGLTIGW